MSTVQNYYAGNYLNRLSYLRSSPAFLASALSSPTSRFILFNNLNPLSSPADKNGAIRLHSIGWEEVKEYIGSPEAYFEGVDGKNPDHLNKVGETYWKGESEGFDKNDRKKPTANEKRHHFINQPPLVFLGVDERSAPSSAQSLPLTKPDANSTLASHSAYGIAIWALDVTNIETLRRKYDRSSGYEFVDMRAGMSQIPYEDAAIAGEGRALVDWNKRNLFCPACSRPTRSVWAGWKRACISGEVGEAGLDTVPVCISKRGVHNFNYPRTDPVVIMAVLSPDRESILLGRQKAWPKKFYSCLAGFIESGETLEEAVRREVYEEAGIVCDEVYYHSSQPWPYPSSLMIGCIAIAKPGQTIRCDLDNELEDARYYTRAEVLAVINSSVKPTLTREEVQRIDGKEEITTIEPSARLDQTSESWFRMPPVTAIANVLIEAWATNSYLNLPGATAGNNVGSGKL